MTNKKGSFVFAVLAVAAGLGFFAVAAAAQNTPADDTNNANAPVPTLYAEPANANAPGRSPEASPDFIGRFIGGMGANRGVRGTISSISGNSVTITIDAAGSVSGLTAGDAVTLIDTAKRTGMMPYGSNANVPAGGPGAPGSGQRFMSGKVTAVSGTTLTIQDGAGTVYTVDASQAKIHKLGSANSSVSDIPAGDRVIVRGTVSGTAIAATDITDLPPAAQALNRIKTDIKTNGAQSFFAKIGDFFKNLFNRKKQ